MLCVKEERNVMCTSTWPKNTQINESGTCCYLTVLGVTTLCHTCIGTYTLSCHPHNQNILQNPREAEVLPNNWINQGQRWTGHVTLSASKLPADTELQQSPPQKANFMHFSYFLCLPSSTSVRQHHLQLLVKTVIMTHNKIYLLQLKLQIPPKLFVIPGIFFF